MSPSIHTLIADIQELNKKKDGWFTEELASDFSKSVADRLMVHYNEEHTPNLRLSQMGPKCPRALWCSIHHPELAQPLEAWAMQKYSFGHIIEAQAIMLAKAAGHLVIGEQDEVVVDGVKGHRDCIIDGCLVDVKSTSSFGFNKFKSGSIRDDDQFGYLDQLDGYLVGSASDDNLSVKDRGYLLAIDKQLGHMCLYEHKLRENSIRERIKDYRQIVESPEPPQCTCRTVKDGESGNFRLDTVPSYSPYKFFCFPGLRTFLYANGPRYLTKVVYKPNVMEVDRYGKPIF